MCQPKPGPRCSGHARARLNAARTALIAAEAEYAEAQSAKPTAADPFAGGSAEQARAARDTAQEAFSDALHEFETTPEGQEALVEAAERAEDFDPAASAAIYRSLNAARATRARQVADLKAAEAMKERLRNVSGAENAALMNARFPVMDAQERLDAAQAEYAAARAQEDQCRPAYDEALAAYTKATKDFQDANAEMQTALDEASRLPGGFSDEEASVRERAVKASLRALEADKKAAEIRADRLDPVMDANAAAARRASQARYAVEDAERDLSGAKAAQDRLTAQIGAGAGTDASTVDWQTAAREVRRNPDGTLNAYVYSPPSDGFPHGRYKRAVGVTAVGSGSALVLEDGTTAYRSETWKRRDNGGDAVREPSQGVLISPSEPGATPITDEIGYKSFSITHDSSG